MNLLRPRPDIEIKNDSNFVLDIGCGGYPKGHVNVDRFIWKSPHHTGYIDPKKINNFVISDASRLPFRKNVFSIVYSSHVIEHLVSPSSALEEFRRVCNKNLIIRIPNDPKFSENPVHLYSWNKISLTNLLSIYFTKVFIYNYSMVDDSRIMKMLNILSKRFRLIGRLLTNLFLKMVTIELIAICQK